MKNSQQTNPFKPLTIPEILSFVILTKKIKPLFYLFQPNLFHLFYLFYLFHLFRLARPPTKKTLAACNAILLYV